MEYRVHSELNTAVENSQERRPACYAKCGAQAAWKNWFTGFWYCTDCLDDVLDEEEDRDYA